MQTVEAGRRIALNNVLFATDFSACSNTALPYALAIGHRYGARLYGAHVVTPDSYLYFAPEAWPAHFQEEEQLQKEALARLEEQLRGVPHQALCGVGDVWDVLGRIIREQDIDLLVVGSHGRTGLGKLFIGSVAETIFRRADCPVLSVGPNVSSKPGGGVRFQHILFATDFSEDSLAALPYAVSLAEEDQAQLTLLHVVEESEAGIADVDAVKAHLMHRLQELVPSDAEPWCHVECLLEFGRQFARPTDRILEIAGDQAADLIVLGVRPVRGKLGLVTHLASTTAQILAQAVCPVLTVRGGCAEMQRGKG
jgi:nucleotide-binding universal stress UspA family protein